MLLTRHQYICLEKCCDLFTKLVSFPLSCLKKFLNPVNDISKKNADIDLNMLHMKVLLGMKASLGLKAKLSMKALKKKITKKNVIIP